MASLIQQRIAIERQRAIALAGMSFGLLGLTLSLVAALPYAATWTSWMALTVWVAVIGLNIKNVREARRRMQKFEEEHGPSAGKQDTI